jgi:hypothetical protein
MLKDAIISTSDKTEVLAIFHEKYFLECSININDALKSIDLYLSENPSKEKAFIGVYFDNELLADRFKKDHSSGLTVYISKDARTGELYYQVTPASFQSEFNYPIN